MSIRMSPNSREVIGAISTITNKQEYLKSTNGALNVSGSFNLTGSAIPASGLTTAVAVQIVDGSGNQITSFGGGTQYTDGGVPPTHPVGNTIEWSDGSNWQTVSTAKPLPVTASLSLTNYALETGGNLATLAGGVSSSIYQSNVKQINGVVPLMGNGVTGTGSQRVTIASDNSAFSVNATLSAETTKVIGTVNQGTSPWVVSLTSTTITGSVAVTNSGTFAVQDTVLDAALIAQETTTSGVKGLTAFGAVTTNAPTYSTTKSDALSLDTSGLLRVSLKDTPSNTNKLLVTADAITIASAQTLATVTTVGTVTTITNPVTVTGTVTTTPPTNASTNIAQINGVTPLMGNGVTGTGSQRVTIASDNTAFSVNATLSAETTKVIGVVRNADGSGNLLTSTANALDVNIKSGFGTSITANQGTAAALSGGWPVINGEAADTTGTFTNATQTTSVTASSLDGYGNVLISITGTYGTATAVFEGSDDGGVTWFGISEADRTDSNVIESGYTSLTNTLRAWQISNPGWDSVRVRSTAVASGTVNVRISPSAAPTSAGASVSIGTALPTGANVIGAVTQSGTWSNTVTQATAASLNATVVGTGTFAVQATLSAETTKVIGTVNQGTSPWVVNDPGLPDALGQTTMAGSTSVAIASNQTAIPVNLSPSASGGWSAYALGNTTNAALTTTQTVSASAGKFGGYMTLINLNAAPCYIQVFDTTGAVTLGTTAPNFVIAIPANSTAALGVGANMELSNGLAIANGIKIAATTTSNGASTVATGVTGTILFK